jgi:HD-like signal output (HDOD) protein
MALPNSTRPSTSQPPRDPSARREAHQADDRSALDVRMRMILAEADFPAISKDALDALKHMPEDDASIQRLANIVLREYALTLKVLRTANSAYYRRSDKTIQSATHAMLLLGARTVRHLAASLLVFEHYRKRSPGLKELMLLSLLTANHAREVAMRRGLPDPEEAHLCGMFRNLGEVLIAGYFPKDYARILQHLETKNRGEAIAAFEVLGFRFEDLGEAMARHWGMPESVMIGIRADGPLASSDIGVITSFAHELTAAVYRREVDAKRDGVAEVLTRYARRLNLTREEVAAMLEHALSETKEVFTSAKVSVDDLKLRRLQKAAIEQIGAWGAPSLTATLRGSLAAPPPAASGAPGAPVSAARQTPPRGAASTTGQASSASPPDATSDASAEAAAAAAALARVREELLAEVIRVAAPASGEDLNRVLLMVLEAILRGGPFDRVVFCMLTPDRNGVKARYGLGAGVEPLLERFTFDLSPREGPIAVALLRRQSLYVPVERDFSAQELRFAQGLGASSFGVFPVVVGTRLVGGVYCDRPWNSRHPDRATLAYVRRLCEGAVKGIEQRQAAMTPASQSRTDTGTQAVLGPAPSHSVSFKGDVVLRMLRGEATAAIAAELGIAESTLEQWRTAFMSSALAGLRST